MLGSIFGYGPHFAVSVSQVNPLLLTARGADHASEPSLEYEYYLNQHEDLEEATRQKTLF
jgi:hypothetical protein